MDSGLALSATATAFENWFAQPDRPTIIVTGNEKGGSGKTTAALHLIVGLLKRGYSVGSIDLDTRQASLTHYIQNRIRYASQRNSELELPEHRRIEAPEDLTPDESRDYVLKEFATTIESLQQQDYIVIDTPGADTFLSRLGHVVADKLITPLNESFLDLDVLIRMDAEGQRILGASAYAHTVLARAERRQTLGGPPTEWFVMQSRRAHVESKNRRNLQSLLKQLSERIGFRLTPGFSERVVYRELFPHGLTVLDSEEDTTRAGHMNGPSSRAAQDEVRQLVNLVAGPKRPF